MPDGPFIVKGSSIFAMGQQFCHMRETPASVERDAEPVVVAFVTGRDDVRRKVNLNYLCDALNAYANQFPIFSNGEEVWHRPPQ